MNARILCVAFPIALVVALACPLNAQDAASDQAKTLLTQGLDQYKALDFQTAKATLVKVDASALNEADKKNRDDVLNKIDVAIKEQSAARETLAQADTALKANDLAKAKDCFAAAAASEYLTEPERKDARTQLAQVQEKLKKVDPVVAEAPATSIPVATKTPTPTTALETLEADRTSTAAKLVARGKTEMDANQFDKAVQTLQSAKVLTPDNKEIDTLLASAQKMVGTPATEGENAIKKLEGTRKILRDIALMEFDKDMQLSREQLTGADKPARFDAAAQAADSARNKIVSNKSVFDSTQEYQDKLSQAEDQIKYVALQRETYNKRQAVIAASQADQANRERLDKIITSKRAAIAALTAKSKDLTKDQKYAESLTIIEQILQLDPNNDYANATKDVLIQMRDLRREKDAYDNMRREWQKTQIAIRETEIPWESELQYPKNWIEITNKRESSNVNSSNETDAERLIRQKLRTKIPKLDFNNEEFANVVDFFRTVSNVNFHPNWQALAAASVDRKTPVNLNLVDVTVEKALQLVLQDLSTTSKLGFVVGDGVVTMSTKEDLAKVPVYRTYDIQDLLFVVPDFTGPVLTLGNNGNNNTNNNNTNTNNNSNNNNDNNTTAGMVTQIITTIKDTVDKDSWVAPGIGSIQEFHGQLIVTQTAENHQAISSLLSMLRESKSLQVCIEARFITVSSGFFNSIGIDVDMYFNLGSQLGGGAPGGGPNYTVDPFTGAHVPIKGTSGWGDGKPGTNEVTPIGIITGGGTGVPGFGTMLGVAGPPGSIANQITTPGLQVQGVFLDDVQVDFIIQATQASSTTRTLTAPRLTLFNGQQAYVSVGLQRAYVSSFTPVVTENTSALVPTVSTVLDGTMLQVQATVSADRRYVTLTVQPSVTRIDSIDTFSLGVGLGSLQLPRITIQELKTTVSVPDGGTLLLGGMRTSNEAEREGGVPILSKIPIIERLFTNRGKVRDEQTLLILIKPKIIIQREQENDAFPPR